MRVVLATCMSIPHTGGASTHFELLSQSLCDAGMLAGRVVGQDGAPTMLHRAYGVIRNFGNQDSVRVDMLRAMASRLTGRIASIVSSTPVDILHCHDPLSSYAAACSSLLRERGIRIIQTVHGPWSREALTSGIKENSCFHQELRRIEESAYASCAGLITVDRGQARILLDEFKTPANKISVIHNAVNCREIQALSKQRGLFSLPKPHFIVPRRLVPKNGVDVAIEALKLLPDICAHLAVAGDGPLARDLRVLAERLGVSDRVHFLGSLPREKLMPLLAGSTGVVVPSVPREGVIEATSLAVIESFACGVPVVASNIGGLAELIRHEETGILFEAGNAPSLARSMARVLKLTDAERSLLCQSARNVAQERWDVTPWFALTSSVYADDPSPALRPV